MKKALLAALALCAPASAVTAQDWITAPSYYTHDQQSGERVTQYTPIGPFYLPQRQDFTRSGFHHTRSSIRVGGSSDNYLTVERWGPPVRPFGEWRFPYRPYSVPYDLWGPPYGGLGSFGPGYYPGYPGYRPPVGGRPRPDRPQERPDMRPGRDPGDYPRAPRRRPAGEEGPF